MENTYAIGDIQGCFDDLLCLLEKLDYNATTDHLWFAGDLINRGPKSLETLRFIKEQNAQCVLGNHDIHLIAAHYGFSRAHPGDSFDDILAAPDRDELLTWLRHQPLLHHEHGYTMLHAGLIPQWDLAQAQAHAKEVEAVLQDENALLAFLPHLYGTEPKIWDESLSGYDRLRFIINVFTRIRICKPDGECDFGFKGPVSSIPEGYVPWFKAPRKTAEDKIIFGHWAALECQTNTPNTFALDSGCVWGRHLTAMRLGDEERFESK